MTMKAPAGVCSRDNAHSGLACSSCHTSWVPTCIGCHNEFDPEEPSYNMIENKEQKGGWVEYIGEYEAKLPALGIRKDGDKTEVIPVVPGMILTIDKKSYTNNENDQPIFQRLYARPRHTPLHQKAGVVKVATTIRLPWDTEQENWFIQLRLKKESGNLIPSINTM